MKNAVMEILGGFGQEYQISFVWLLIHFNKKEVYSDTQKKITAPDLNGMSGTPIWGFTGGSEKIVAILTDHVKREKKVVLGRRVNDIRSWLNDLLNAD